ncbi:MAG: hypothetical protein EAZ97_01745 [Bacteroidetes bacterium]|nr:MAG: hypothetical protein EAZ97_01745 [Bacteroidota bacterium]
MKYFFIFFMLGLLSATTSFAQIQDVNNKATNRVGHILLLNEQQRAVKNVEVIIDEIHYLTDFRGECTTKSRVTDQSNFRVVGYEIIKMDYVDIDQYMYIHIKTNEKVRAVDKVDSTLVNYTQNFNYIFNKLELEKQLLAEKSKQINSDIEAIIRKLKTDITFLEKTELRGQLNRLERQLIENEVAYETAHEKTNEVLARMKLFILEKDSLHSLANEKIEQVELEKKLIEAISSRNLIISVLIVFFLLGLASIFYRISQKIRKQRNELEEKVEEINHKNEEMQIQAENLKHANDEISHKGEALQFAFDEIAKKNQDITASINYARRMQRSLLPQPNALKEYLPESFILLRPRDIVSGDFYWFKEIKNEEGLKSKFIMAAVDCTGHGVPGAFMSLVADSLLNQIILFQEIYSPDEILNHLHNGVRTTLRQDASNNRDGMDIALCCIDQEHKKLEFAGAKNPLVYVQNQELKELKADRISIGGLQERSTYRKQTIGFEQETTCYIFSDGYHDQFGGTENKKFMRKNFNDLLLKVHSLPMENQRITLAQTLDQWIGHRKQLDDILVIGFKLS